MRPVKQHAASPSAHVRLRRAARQAGTWLLVIVGLLTGLVFYGLLLLDRPQPVDIPLVKAEALPEIAWDTEPPSPGAPGQALSFHPDFPIIRIDRKDPQVENILLVGLEQHSPAGILVVSCDRRRQSVRLAAVLGSCQTALRGRSQPEPLASAFAYGGIGHLVNTCNETLGLDIQRFVLFDLAAVPALADRLGGLSLTVREAEVTALLESPDAARRCVGQSLSVSNEPQRLDGRQVSVWASLDEPFLDETRTPRTHAVLTGLTLLACRSPLIALQLLDEGLDDCATNMSVFEMAKLAGQFLIYPADEPVLRVPGEGLFAQQDEPWRLTVSWEQQKAGLHAFVWGDAP